MHVSLLKTSVLSMAILFNSIASADVTTRGHVLTSTIWNTNSIHVCWENLNDSTAADRASVREAVENSWEANSNVNFFGWNECERSSDGIRIQVADSTEFGAHVDGLGTRIRGRQNGMSLNFTYENWNQNCQSSRRWCNEVIAVHEFGHALGFAHEQNRQDTPDTCDEPTQGTNGDIDIGRWDLSSVMNYCNPQYNGNGELSETDILMVRTFYGPEVQTSVLLDNDHYSVYVGSNLTINAAYSIEDIVDSTSWLWSLGDGASSSSQNSVTHSYANKGRYNVTVSVSDSEGYSADKSAEVYVYGFEALLPAINMMMF
ncbi:PKD domain-containing protein [Pseudoalteromonas luteoviolacea]|uniref:PKD domain-containing protein n=1 Tax=Pseudoalteromonas luteoviolacea TaxID=43657 RepID=UPI001B38A0EA|nr:M57 family metalloprotease [Pseudoalteromonas luteoviolacea]MBQ4837222.1 PKD domain-containing protein [Pseudoalteromonas luteoviolacea]